MPRPLLLAAVLLLAGCAISSGADTARMPLAATGGPVMNEDEAIGMASWVLLNPGIAADNPERGARAVAAEDWLAGQTALSPDFAQYQPAFEYFWRTTRDEVRAAVGIAPGTPSQLVVDRMLAAAAALQAGDKAGAAAQFQPPAFTRGGAGTLAALAALPAIPAAQSAFAQLRLNENRSTGHCNVPGAC